MHAKQFVTSTNFRVVLLLENSESASKKCQVAFGTASILHFCGNSVWG